MIHVGYVTAKTVGRSFPDDPGVGYVRIMVYGLRIGTVGGGYMSLDSARKLCDDLNSVLREIDTEILRDLASAK